MKLSLRQVRNIIATGFTAPSDGFDPNLPYRACLLCGEVYQNEDDELRNEWARKHAKQSHTQRDHMLLLLSGNVMTPEAASKLAAYGVIPVSDMVFDEEVSSALAESTPELS